MDLSYSPEQIAFREEVRAWIADAMPPEMRKKADDGANFSQEESMEWHKILYAKGWVAPNWPEEVGGTGWDIGRRSIFQDECVRAGTPQLSPFGLSMVGPLLIQYGSPEQKERFLPKILSGEEVWCQGYSEPNAGSDLANLQLRADKDGDDYILNGQKTWTTYAQYADWIFVLCRTNNTGKKQEGISFLLADINNTEGIEVKPFLTTGGTLAFSETWFKDARVPQANRVGPEDGGWTMAKALLAHERTGIGGIAESAKQADEGEARSRSRTQGRQRRRSSTTREFPQRGIARKQMRLRSDRDAEPAHAGRRAGGPCAGRRELGAEDRRHRDAAGSPAELCMDAMGHNAMGWLDSPEAALPSNQQAVASQFNYLTALPRSTAGSNESPEEHHRQAHARACPRASARIGTPRGKLVKP